MPDSREPMTNGASPGWGGSRVRGTKIPRHGICVRWSASEQSDARHANGARRAKRRASSALRNVRRELTRGGNGPVGGNFDVAGVQLRYGRAPEELHRANEVCPQSLQRAGDAGPAARGKAVRIRATDQHG